MMKALLIPFMMFCSWSARASILFIDLNESPKEAEACRQGAQDASANDEVVVVAPPAGSSKVVNMDMIMAKVREARRKGINFDSVVVSGEDGSGHFFGTQGDFYASDFKKLINDLNQGGSRITTTALWGCYPTNKYGCETYWLKPHPSINMAVGFASQAPNGERPIGHELMKEFCKNREEAANAVTFDQMCLFYRNLSAGRLNTSVSVCNREGVASDFYDPSGSGKRACQTNDELDARCKDFDPDRRQLAVFERCMNATDSRYDQNCKDVPGKVSALRQYYNQLHLWRHCKEVVKTDQGYEMPTPPQVIRLLKFDYVKENLANFHEDELAEYDERLSAEGLDQYALGDITGLSRAQLNQKIEGAIVELKRSGADPALLKMAEGLGRTFVSIDPRCSHFSNVTLNLGKRSTCILSYAQASSRTRAGDE